jgi:HK97 family phage prohead protease
MNKLGFALDLKKVSDEGEFEGHASTFGNRDLGGDIVVSGAFKKTLKQKGPSGVKMLLDHDPRQRIGVWTHMEEDEKGLYVKGKLLVEKQIGKEAYIDLKAGALDSMSIGFRTVDWAFDGRRKARMLKELDLVEISLVTFPMNEAAKVAGVKSVSEMTIREVEAALESGTLPPLSSKQAKALLACGYKALQAERDAGTEDEANFMREFLSRLQALRG